MYMFAIITIGPHLWICHLLCCGRELEQIAETNAFHNFTSSCGLEPPAVSDLAAQIQL